MVIKTLRDFGAAIRNTRKANGLTQADLAGRLGTSQDWISNIESGRIENPSLSKILQICKALDIDIKLEPGSATERNSAGDQGRPAKRVPAFVRNSRR